MMFSRTCKANLKALPTPTLKTNQGCAFRKKTNLLDKMPKNIQEHTKNSLWWGFLGPCALTEPETILTILRYFGRESGGKR